MRILYVVHQFFPKHYTGTERLVLNLSKQMQRMGHSVKVLTYGITETEGFRQEGDFLIKDYEFQGVPVISIRHKIIPQDVSFTIFDPKMEKILGKIFSNEKFDIIHVCHSMRVGSIIRVAKHRNIPIVLTLTDFWLMCPRGIAVTQKGELCYDPEDGMKCVRECYGNLWKDKLIQRFNETNELFQVVDCVVCATNFLKQIYEINNFSSNIKLIRFGKDYRNVRHNIREYSENSEITLGFLSTLLPHKGAHVLLEAYNKANMGNIRLKIYGDYFGEIEYYNRLKKLAKENKKIEFCGKYKYEEIPDILDELDMIVVPSIWWENSPLVLLRALAHNVPAIVSDLGGMTEVIKDGENGFAFEAGSAESLAEVLRKIGEKPYVLNEMKTKIHPPPRIEEEAFEYEKIYAKLKLFGRSEAGPFRTTVNSEVITPLPKHVTISNTYKCNLKCIMCFKRFESNTPYMQLPSMSDELIDKIIYELFPHIETFSLTVGGEPLADKNYKKFIGAAKKFNVKLKLVTNGVLLNNFQTIKDILKVSESIEVSIEGLGNTYESIRTGSKFGIIDRNIKLLVNTRNKLDLMDKVKIEIDIVLMKKNVEQLPDLLLYASDIGIDCVNATHLVVVDKSLSDESLVNHKVLYNTIYDRSICAVQTRNIKLVMPPKFVIKNENKNENKKSIFDRINDKSANIVNRKKLYCHFIYEQSWIKVNGDVVPCCIMPTIMGNIEKSSFEEVWNNKNYSKLRDSFKTGDIPECCKNCYLINQFTDPDKAKFDEALEIMGSKNSTTELMEELK